MSDYLPITELEREIMDVIWQKDKMTVREVMNALNAGDKQRAYTTVMTVMKKLYEKNILVRSRYGKTDYYTTACSCGEYCAARAQVEIDAMIEAYGDMALIQLVATVDKLPLKKRHQLQKLVGE